MGTKRSRHNKGRKPLYKEIGRETSRREFFFEERELIGKTFKGEKCFYCKRTLLDSQADSLLAATKDHFTPQSDGGTIVVPCCFQCNQMKGSMPALRWEQFMRENPRWWKVDYFAPRARRQSENKVVELLPVVAAYLEKRKTNDARKAANELFPTLAETPAPAARIVTDEELTFASGKFQSSDNDVLMQLFVERRISASKFHAGRRWQRWREETAIQPCSSIDWSGKLRVYQKRGDLRDKQIDAMEYRRHFLTCAGPVAYAFADFCLDADRGLKDLMALLKTGEHQVWRAVSDLLEKMCFYAFDQRDVV